MKKVVLGLLACAGILLACVGTGAWRYSASGTNPLREIRRATLGESIEIKEEMNEPVMGPYRQLIVDSIAHGTQFDLPAKGQRGDPLKDFSRLPTTYYHPDGPVGLVLRQSNWFPGPPNTFHADARLPASLVGNGTHTTFGSPWAQIAVAWSEPPIGVIIMNNGTLAAYARPYQAIDFYERAPAIVGLSIAKEPDLPKFTYIADAQKRGAMVRVLEGDERKVFAEKAPQNYYRYLFVDTCHGHPGLVAKELLTQEALRGYFAALVEDGIVAIHTSSRDFDLAAVVAATATSVDLAHLVAKDGAGAGVNGHYSSEWVLLARKAEYFKGVHDAHALLPPPPPQRPALPFQLHPIETRPALIWKDGGSNSLAPVLR